MAVSLTPGQPQRQPKRPPQALRLRRIDGGQPLPTHVTRLGRVTTSAPPKWWATREIWTCDAVKVEVAFNPTAGAGDRVLIVEAWRDALVDEEFWETTPALSAWERARLEEMGYSLLGTDTAGKELWVHTDRAAALALLDRLCCQGTDMEAAHVG